MEKLKKLKKIIEYLICSLEFAVGFFLYTFITSRLANVDPKSVLTGMSGLDISLYIGLLMSFLVPYSLMRFWVLYDSSMRERFLSDGDGVYKIKEHFTYLIAFPRTRVLLILSVIVSIIYPSEIISMSLHGISVNALIDIAIKAVFSLIFLICTFLIYFIASRSACAFWAEDKRRPADERLIYKKWRIIPKIATLCVAYLFGGLVFILLTYQLTGITQANASGIMSQKTRWAIWILIIFAAFVFVIKQIKMLTKRRKFIKDLERVCAENRCSLSKIRAPYLSLYKNIRGYDFDFERNGKRYACKLLSTKNKLHPITFFDGGMAAHEKIIRVKKTELFRVRSWFEYSFEADAKKILVINPVPKTLMINDKGRVAVIDNGDSVDGYKIYSATALVNAIDRNTLDR